MSALILLVEDSSSDEKLTLAAFKRSGVVVDIVVERDGADALDYLFGMGRFAGGEPPPRPVVVLLDLHLPRIDGFEVLSRIRADDRTRLLPVVVLTASKQDEDVARCYERGASAYVHKPVEFTEFVEAARALAHFWIRLNEAPPAHRMAR